jgi:hypothetical protein
LLFIYSSFAFTWIDKWAQPHKKDPKRSKKHMVTHVCADKVERFERFSPRYDCTTMKPKYMILKKYTHSLTAVILFSSLSSNATAESVAQGDTPRVIMLASRDSKEETTGVIRAVKGHLSGLFVQFEVEWTDAPSGSLRANTSTASDIATRTDALIVFWCDLSMTEDVYLYFSDKGQRRILVRRLDVGEAETKYESLAVIVYSIVDAMQRGGQIGVVPASPPIKKKETTTTTTTTPEVPKPKEEIAASRKKNDHEFSLQLSYLLRTHSENQVLLNGFFLGASFGIIPHFYLFGGYTFSQSVSVYSEQVQFKLEPHPMTLGAGLDWSIARFRLGVALSFGVDYLVQETKRAKGALPVDNEYVIVSTSPIITTSVRLSGPVHLHLKIGVQFDLKGVEYTESDASDAPILCAPWRVIPFGQLGITFYI